MNLSPKQQNFCDYYIELGNASEAYRKAYPRSLKWKDKTVNEAASRLLKNSKVNTRVRELQKDASMRNELTVDDLIKELKRMMLFNPIELYSEDGSLIPAHELSDEITACISSIDVVEVDFGAKTQRKTKLRFYNKLEAIEKLAKHIGFYDKDNKTKDFPRAVIVLPDNGRDRVDDQGE